MDEEQKRVDVEEPQQPTDAPVETLETPEKTHGVMVKEKKKFHFHKMHMIFIAVALASLAVVLFFVLGESEANEPADTSASTVEQAEVAQLASALTIAEGTVERSTDGETWSAVTGGETIAVMDYVRTLSDSRAVILLDDGSVARLDANTQIQLTAVDASLSEVTLVDGQVYTRVAESDSRTFAVVTENERFEALGTAYKTSAGEAMDSVEVYESKVKVDSDGTEIEEGNKYDTEKREKESIDLDKLKDDPFLQWNKEKDSEIDEYKDKLGVLDIKEVPKEDAPAPVNETPVVTGSIALRGAQISEVIELAWTLNEVEAPDGFKVVFDKSDTTPTYKENSSHYVSSSTRIYSISPGDGQAYNFRVCIYRAASGTCDTYSNVVSAVAPLVEKELVESGDVLLEIDDTTIDWTFAGTAPHGFKVVLSSSEGPTYPANSVQYIGAGTLATSLPEKPAGTYYVKVCKYTADSKIDGGCTDYSNQVEYVVAE